VIFYRKTLAGRVSIRPVQGRWCVFLADDNLGSYHSPEAAADDAAGGHTFAPPSGVALGTLGLSRNLDEWERGT